MQQVLFHFPIVGLPLYGFGAMLLLAFFAVLIWGKWRTPKVGLPWERFQDMSMLLLGAGIAGARIVYMIQYSDKYPDRSILGLMFAFLRIWDGGIVFYGSIFGGLIAYLIFRQLVLKRLGVNGWQLADTVAPMLALGMAVGRIGCYLNGCCWGQVACPECQPVPLSAELGKFPLLTAHAKEQVVWPADDRSRLPEICGLQTTTGFSLRPRSEYVLDSRSVVLAVEPGSPAEQAQLKADDKIVEVNGQANTFSLEILGKKSDLDEAKATLVGQNGIAWTELETQPGTGALLAEIDDPAMVAVVQGKLAPFRGRLTNTLHDRLTDIVRQWPRGQSRLSLVVERAGTRIPISFTPRTVSFFPTQVYETVSMILLMLLLLAFQPFRRHDGQVIVLLMLGYALHRFLNESIRIEPTYRFGLTLSQWISIGIFTAGVLLELYLRFSQTKLPPGPIPLGYGAKPAIELK